MTTNQKRLLAAGLIVLLAGAGIAVQSHRSAAEQIGRAHV